MGQLLEILSSHEKDRIIHLARAGATDEDIAADVRIPLKRLQKRYRRDLEQARAKGKHEILIRLYQSAESGSNTAATTFWVKSRFGWRDTGASTENSTIIRPVLRMFCKPK